jgi:hypothetical protein
VAGPRGRPEVVAGPCGGQLGWYTHLEDGVGLAGPQGRRRGVVRCDTPSVIVVATVAER